MVYRGVVAIVSVVEGRRVTGEQLRFIPLAAGDDWLAAGNRRLRVTRANKGDGNPVLLERNLYGFAGRLVAADATGFDEEWLYGCVDMAQN
jgi:hypothetical protein